MAERVRPVLGIDINNKEIRVVQMSGVWSDMQVMMADSVATPPGALQNGRITAPEMAAVALRGLLSKMHVTTRDAVFGVPPRAVMSRIIEIPRVPDDEIPTLISGEIEHYHLLHEGDGVFDYALMGGELAAQRPNLSVLLMAAEEQLLSGYREVAKQAGLNLVALEPTLLAMYRTAYVQVQEDSFTACLTVGQDSAEIAVVTQGEIGLYRRIGIGADDLVRGRKESPVSHSLVGSTEAQAAPPPPLLGVDDEFLPDDDDYDDYDAEEAVLPPDAYAMIEPMSARGLATELERSLDYYRRENPAAAPLRRILIALDDPELEVLPMWLSEGLSQEIVSISLPATAARVVPLAAPDSWRFTGAIGLAMRNLPNHPANVPRFDLTRRRKHISPEMLIIRRKVTLSGLAAAVVFAFSISAGIPLGARTTALEHALATDKQNLARKQAALTERLHTQLSHQEELDSLRAQTIPFAPIMDAVIGAIDARSSLSEVSLTPSGKVMVMGEAINEQAIINTLNSLRASPFFDHPTLDSYRINAAPGSPGALMQFQLSAPLSGSLAPAPAPTDASQRH